MAVSIGRVVTGTDVVAGNVLVVAPTELGGVPVVVVGVFVEVGFAGGTALVAEPPQPTSDIVNTTQDNPVTITAARGDPLARPPVSFILLPFPSSLASSSFRGLPWSSLPVRGG
jgi:hypothetical protein